MDRRPLGKDESARSGSESDNKTIEKNVGKNFHLQPFFAFQGTKRDPPFPLFEFGRPQSSASRLTAVALTAAGFFVRSVFSLRTVVCVWEGDTARKGFGRGCDAKARARCVWGDDGRLRG